MHGNMKVAGAQHKNGEEMWQTHRNTDCLLHLHQNKPSPCTSATFRPSGRNTEERRLLSFRLPSVLIPHAGSSQGCQIEPQLSRHEDEVAAPSTAHLFITGTHEETDNPTVRTSLFTRGHDQIVSAPDCACVCGRSLLHHVQRWPLAFK